MMTYSEIAPKFRKRKAYAAEWQRARDNIISGGEYKELEVFISDFTLPISSMIPVNIFT